MNQKLLDQMLQSPRLPSLPAIALEVIDLVQRQDVNVKQIAHTIQHDPALAGKILKTVNSSFYAQSHAVGTISHALVILGLNSVKTLALGFSLVGNLTDRDDEAFDHVRFWKRSLYTACAAKRLASQTGLVQKEEAFLGGLLQDLGMIAMHHTLGQPYLDLIHQAGDNHHELLPLERRILGLDHTVVGAALAERWRLPPLLVAPIRYHERPDEAEGDLVPLIRTVALGNHVADVFMHENAGGSLERYYHLAESWCGLSQEEAEPLLKEIHQETRQVRRLFDLPTGELGNPDDILARANEALLQITLRTQQQSTQLEQQNRQLVEQAITDSLTGTANRRRFNEFIIEQFQNARQDRQPLSVLFLDADNFKQFNDTYGHPTGDRVLIELASLLKHETPECGIVARYGGEEFAIVLPATSRRTAARLAEHIRRELEASRITSDDGESLQVTASIGVATFECGVFGCVEHLIKAADQAVYAAKASGRNCVRVFAPKRPLAA